MIYNNVLEAIGHTPIIKLNKITEKGKIKPVFLRLDSEFATDKKKGQ